MEKEPLINSDELHDLPTSSNQETEKGVEQEKLPEVEELEELFKNEEFVDRLVLLQVEGQRKNLELAEKAVEKAVQQLVNPLKNEAALKIVGLDDVKSAQKLGKAWGEALKQVEEISIFVDGDLKNVSINEAEEYFKDHLLTDESQPYSKNIQQAMTELSQAEDLERARAAAMLVNINDSKHSSRLSEALDIWGKSPNSKNDRGSDGKGYNSGVIHYFEYRADIAKNGRFKGEKSYSLENFIEYSQGLKELMENYQPEQNESIEASMLLRDSSQNERMFVLTKDKQLLVGFRHATEKAVKAVSIIPGRKIQEFDQLLKEEQDTENEKTKGRLNRLEGSVEVIYDSRA